MTTRRRRLGSETEHHNIAESDISNQVLKGPSSVLLGSGNQFQQPSFFIVPAGAPESQFPSASSYTNYTAPNVLPKPGDSVIMPLAGGSSTSLLSSSTSSSRDRTKEFFAAVDSLKSRQPNGVNNTQSVRRLDPTRHQHSEFTRAAKELASDLSATWARLEQLTDLVKKQSIFDDNPGLVQEYIGIIQEDIKTLNKKIAQLQSFMKRQQDQKLSAKAHSTNVVVSLQSKLAMMSTEFKQVLNLRTESMKAQQSRREQYVTRDPLVSDLPPAALMGGPFGSSSSGASGSVLWRDAQTHGANAVAIDMGGAIGHATNAAQMQMHADDTESYLQSRADAVKAIESTVVELGAIFGQLAGMLREQEEDIRRIDSNVDDAYLNVESAHDELLRYFRGVTSNRWLMIKAFGIIFVFIIIFAVFFA